MNKIYKVIWSKVKNQYVVVSELAHSNGKQSRTSRNSIRSRIAALVVCGAIAAFGVFSAVPNSAYAETGGKATESQYIAIAVSDDNNRWGDERKFGNYTYQRQTVTINGSQKQYWVREGYDISVVYDKRYDGADDSSAYIIDAKKNDQYNQSSDQGLLQAYQTTTSKGQITTLTGVNIEDLNTGVYGGASNAGGVKTSSDFGYHIKVNGLNQDADGYIKVSDDLDGAGSGENPGVYGNTNFETYFSHNVTLENDGTYSYTHGNEKVTVPTNKVYSIDGKLGVFTDAKGNLYTGDVYGDHNEILLSAVGEGNQIYSYWGTKVNDPTQTIGNMTVQDYNSDRKKLQDQAAAYHGDDITNIAVGGANNNGTISLNRVGQYNDQTGKYETTDPVPGTITVTSTGGNGGNGAANDVKIKFASENGGSFTVDAGSKVEAIQGQNDKISAIKINGQQYNLGTGGTITGSFNLSTGEISVEQDGQSVLAGRVHDWKVTSANLDNNGTLTIGSTDTYNEAKTNSVTVNNVASTGYVTNQIETNNTAIKNYFNTNDKYLSGASINENAGTLDLTVANANGEGVAKTYNLKLKDYIAKVDDYVDSVQISEDKQSLVLHRKNGTSMSVGLADLISAGGISTSDYQLIANPAEDSEGKYTVKDGKVELTVQNGTNEQDRRTVTISDVASAQDVSKNKTSIENINTTLANGVVKYDYDEGTEQYKNSVTLKEGTQIHNLAAGTEDTDAVNVSQLKNNVYDKYLSGASINENAGTLDLTVANANGEGVAKTYNLKLKDYIAKVDDYVDSVQISEDKQSLVLHRKNGTSMSVGLADLISAGGISTSDYQLIANPAEDSEGKYTVKDGKVELTVQNGTNEQDRRTVTISDVASATKLSSVDNKVGNIDYSSNNYINDGDSLTEAASDLDTAIKDTTDKVDAGWKATAGGTSIDVKPKEDGVVPTLNFAGDKNISVTADKASSTINVELNPNLEVESVKASGDVYTTNIAGEKEYSLKDIGYNTQAIKYAGDHTAVDGILSADKIQNENRSFMVEENGNITAGKVKVYATTGEVTGLTNTTWDGTTNNVTRAATEGQLQDVVKDIETNSYKGWNVTTNGGETEANKAEVASKGNVDFSNTDENIVIGQDGTNLTFDLNDNITLGDESGTRIQLNGNLQKDSMISITNKDSDTVFNVAKDGTVHSDGDIVAKADSNKKYSLSEVGENAVRYNENKSTVALAGTNGTTITNVADGDVSEGSKEAVNGSQLYATNQKVDAGWVATDGTNKIEVNPTDSGTTTLNFAGDNNITVTADTTNKAIQVALNDKVYLGGDHTEDSRNIVLDGERGVIGLGSNIALDGRDGTAVIGGVNITTTAEEGTGKPVSTINGLSNTTWTGTTETPDRAATEGQLQSVATEAAKHTTVSGDENITVKHEEGSQDYQVTLNPDVTLKGDNSSIELNGTKGTMQVNQETTEGTDFTNINGNVVSIGYTNKEGTKNAIVIDGGEGTITGLSNTTWDGSTNDISRAATEGQLKAVSDTVNAGWIATDNSGKEVAVNPDNNKLKFAGDDNITVSATTDENNNNAINVKLNDNITLGNGQSAITLNGSPENSNDPALSVGTDKFVVAQDGSLSVSDKFNVDAETGNIYAANNSGSAIMMNDDSVALNAGGNGIVASDEGILLNTNGINEDIKLVTKGTSVSVDSNGTTFTNTNTNETTNINGGTINVGDKLMVEEDGSIYATNNNGSTVMINDNGVALNSEGNGVVVSGEGITLNTNGSAVTVDRFNGTTFTNTNTGETTNINGGTITTNTVKGLSNTTWDDELAKQVANSEELQGTAATQGQLQQAVNEVAEVANAGWTASDGTNSISIKPNETLNFVGDKNLTVSADGTDKKLKVSLNDDITLGNTEAGNTEGERSFTINTTNPEGYVPESYKTGSGADFIDENGGFMLFATNTQGYGVFGVTAKGSAWAKDFKTYTTDIYGNNTQYSLNEIGDAVAQMSSYYNEENGKSYTVFSRYLNEAEKDNPFVTVDERDIPLALRDDGAVLIGATIKGEDFTDNGIRINAETDDDGNNVATITGLENTEWKPPTPVATLAANDGSATVTSRAATESQLNDLYSAVAAYDVNADGTVNYNHITLAGTPYNYGLSRSTDGTPTGGTSITNVAYASGNDGSEAVNVDYLNNAIKDAVKDGPVASNEKHLDTSKTYTPDKTTGTITINEVDGTGAVTGNQLVINDVASKAELDSLKTSVGDRNYKDVTDTTPIANGDSVTTAIGKLNNSIKGVTQDVINNSISGGHVDETGKVVLEKGEGENKSEVTTDIQLTDSEVSGVTLEKDTETGKNVLTITSTDKYDKNKTSSVTVSGLEIASTDDIKDVTGVASSEDLKDAYKDADKDGNATTEYITDSESMVEADVALDHAIQDVAGTSYANDMVLSNRIDSVEKRLGNVEERIDKVGAMAAAIANLRTMGFDPEAPTEIAIGVGQYKSETGIAIGVFHYPNQDFMLSASLSSSGDELMGGIGATWKLGRKSAAERAKDEEARHLEQAEEMKKLAQQEKVKAQAQRHAKLLAERQQASQKNA